MRRIEDEAARMGVLVEDLLTLARLDQVADAAARRARRGRARGRCRRGRARDRARREIHVDGDAAAPVLGDAHQLRQVLGNLLRNAIVHTPAGTPIEVSVEPRPDVRVTCATTAPGCPPTTPTRSSSASGAPRAAASAARAARASGWRSSPGSSTPTRRVRAGNADGGGAAFVVELPALRSDVGPAGGGRATLDSRQEL